MASNQTNVPKEEKKKWPLLPEHGPVPVLAPGETIQIRILGFMNSPSDDNPKKINYAGVCDFEMPMTFATTIRDVKDFTLARFSSLRYYQIAFEYWNYTLKDICTLEVLMKRFPFFPSVKCLHLHITMRDDMFKMMFKTFNDMGMNEEMALRSTKTFMSTVHDREVDREYDIAERLERCRVKLLKYGIILNNPPGPTPCE